MLQEEIDFQYFKDNQLDFIDTSTGKIDSFYYVGKHKGKRVNKDIGSLNHDGYSRIWCNKKLRMKHRFIFWYVYGYIPKEIDHIDGNRNNNSISNLREVSRSENTSNKFKKRSYKELTEQQVHEICKLLLQGDSITSIALKFNRSRCHIKAIKLKKYWKRISDLYFK